MKKKEKYTILEENFPYFKCVDLILDSVDSTIEIKNIEEVTSIEKLKKRPFLSSDKVILALSSSKATTIETTFSIERDNPKDPISMSELDNIVFKGLWNFLNTYRSWTSDKMGVSDLDMTLANIEILKVFVDSHNVVNSLNIKGKKFSMIMRGTFIPRKVLSFFSEYSFFNKKLSIVEKSSATSSFMTEEKGVTINCDNNEVNSFRLGSGEMKFIDKKKVGFRDILEKMSKSLNLNEDQSLSILDKYLKDEVSTNLKRHLNKEFKFYFSTLSTFIDKNNEKSVKNILINTPKEIYELIPKKKKKYTHVDFEKILKSKGFSVIINEEENVIKSLNRDYLAIAGFYLFHSPHHENLNKILQRRSKWLVPENV